MTSVGIIFEFVLLLVHPSDIKQSGADPCPLIGLNAFTGLVPLFIDPMYFMLKIINIINHWKF